MLMIVASRSDEAARLLAERWRALGAVLVTACDLSVAGWRDHVGCDVPATAGVDGRVVPAADVSGVLTRLAAIDERELTHIVPDDRGYVAQEMTAFLASWLSRLSCPILNRPSPGCLAGPPWRRERWIHEAAQLEIPVRPVRRGVAPGRAPSPEPPAAGPVTITIVGDRWFGEGHETLADQARRLADAAGVDLLAVHFSGPRRGARLLGADVWPDVTAPGIGEAIVAYLVGRQAC
jgi:hypothetical protein